MNLWIKVMVLLVFSELKYLKASVDECIQSKSEKLAAEGKCIPFVVVLNLTFVTTTVEPPKTRNNDPVEVCCFLYYLSCFGTKSIRKHCEKETEGSTDFDEKAKTKFKETKQCAPTKAKCAPFHKNIPDGCSAYSECQSYTWSSFSPISMNGLVLWLSLAVYFIVSQFI